MVVGEESEVRVESWTVSNLALSGVENDSLVDTIEGNPELNSVVPESKSN